MYAWRPRKPVSKVAEATTLNASSVEDKRCWALGNELGEITRKSTVNKGMVVMQI